MTQDIGMLRAQVRRDAEAYDVDALMPQSPSNIDPHLHEMFVCAEMASYWKKRSDEVKADAVETVGDDEKLQAAITRVSETDSGESITLAIGDQYQLTCDLSKPANRLDAKALARYMQIELGISKAAVDTAIAACTKKNAPAKKFKVIGR